MHCKFENRIMCVLSPSNVTVLWIPDQLESCSALRNVVFVPLNMLFLIQHNCWNPGPLRASGNFSTDCQRAGYSQMRVVFCWRSCTYITHPVTYVLWSVGSCFLITSVIFWTLKLKTTNLHVSFLVANVPPGPLWERRIVLWAGWVLQSRFRLGYS